MPDSAKDNAGARVLVVEDEDALRDAYGYVLRRAGFRVQLAADGHEAIAALDGGPVDAVVSDISMPGMNGMEVLRTVRARDLDVPVILNTGNPSVETAAEALQFGALRYLVKPVDSATLVEAVREAVKLGNLARIKREAAAYLGLVDRQVGDRAGLEISLDRAIRTLSMVYQPIVDPAARRVAGYEALVRTAEPALPNPSAIFGAAERLGRVGDVGRAIRQHVAATLERAPDDTQIFINIHPDELQEDDLFSTASPLARFARRVVLEITERAPIGDGAGAPERVKRLRRLGYRIAVDDLGSGYAGLNYFALLTPDIVKLDIALVRNIAGEPVKQKLLGSMAQLCRDLDITVIAEGVETAAERDAVGGLGCALMQGYLFAMPGPPFPPPRW